MFLAHAARLKVRVKQLDFVGAFLQAKEQSRVFVKMPAIHGEVFPDIKQYCGKPLRLLKSMYGMTLSRKYWYQELQEFLIQMGFTQSTVVRCLFHKKFSDGSQIMLLDYVDDLIYFGTKDATVKQFEEQLSARFELELMGQAHWYLSTCITQLANFDITIDQTRYCMSILKRYLETAGCPNNTRCHPTPFALDFTPSADDNSTTEEEARTLSMEYNIDFATCVGSLIYLALTKTDIILYAVIKLAKITRNPGRKHFEAIIHLLRYLMDNPNLGVTFYSDERRSPIYQSLMENNITPEGPLFAFSDLSWNDDIDTGRSTECYLII